MCGAFGERDARRFASLDARRFQTVQQNLFALDDATPASASTTHGFDLASLGESNATRADDLGGALAAIGTGVLDAPGLVRSMARPQDGRMPLLAGLDAFERARARHRARTTVLYALPRSTADATLYTDDAPALT